MEVHPSTAKRFAREGVLHAVRANDSGLLLFEPGNRSAASTPTR